MSISKDLLYKQAAKGGLENHGIKDKKYIQYVVDFWHDENSNKWRWDEIERFDDHKGKILDMSCGVGTFLFYGLHKGYDVYGVEPEGWKLEYMYKKIDEFGYPKSYKEHIINGVGEELPFEDEEFDLIVSFQTLEHVGDVEKCLDEMARTLKGGGKMRLMAPDYESFYEPHYRVPFLPKMNKKLASFYLKLLRRPTKGLYALSWTSAKDIKKYLAKHENLHVIDLSELYYERYKEKFYKKYKLYKPLSDMIANVLYYRKVYTCKEEKQINIVAKKR